MLLTRFGGLCTGWVWSRYQIVRCVVHTETAIPMRLLFGSYKLNWGSSYWMSLR